MELKLKLMSMFNLNQTNKFLFFMGIFGTIFIGSVGIDIYNSIEKNKFKNIEDVERDMFAFGWFVGSIVLACISVVVGTIFSIFLKDVSPDNPEYGWIWNTIINGIAIISASLGWDLTTRIKGLTNYYQDRKFFVFLTFFYILLWFVSIKSISFNPNS